MPYPTEPGFYWLHNRKYHHVVQVIRRGANFRLVYRTSNSESLFAVHFVDEADWGSCVRLLDTMKDCIGANNG